MTGSGSIQELAVLGLLGESPMHGYELRKQLSATLGTFRAFSFGSLYPSLKRLLSAGHIAQEAPEHDEDAIPLSSRRSRVVYRIIADGKERLADLLADAGPQSWSDDGFGVHLAFFARTTADVRMRILEGRRRRVEERREGQRSARVRAVQRLDRYTTELHQLGLQASEREVRWLDELIDHERRHHRDGPPCGLPADTPPPTEHTRGVPIPAAGGAEPAAGRPRRSPNSPPKSPPKRRNHHR